MRPPHECLGGQYVRYTKDARSMDDRALKETLLKFEGPWAGSTPGGKYQTTSWRAYKRAFRQEAHRRGITI